MYTSKEQFGQFAQVLWYALDVCHLICRRLCDIMGITMIHCLVTQESKKNSLKIKRDLVMACHTPPLKTAKEQGEVPLSILSPFPFTQWD